MPAASLARLQTQIHELAWLFTRPGDFQRALNALLEGYADLTYRGGKTISPVALVQTYRAPALVMRQLNLDLGRLCLENPIQGLAVIDILRGDPWLEPQLIAVGLLGQMPPDDLVTGRLEEWARPKLVKPVLDALLVEGTARLRREAPDDFLELVHKWLINPDPAVEAMGLRALYPLVEERSYENLPAVFNLLSNAIHSVSNLTQNPLQRLIEALASRSATETSFFIRQMASVTSDPSVKRFMRRCIPLLPARAQSGLRDLL